QDRLERGCLAAGVPAEQADDLPREDLHVHVAEDAHRAVVRADVAKLEQRGLSVDQPPALPFAFVLPVRPAHAGSTAFRPRYASTTCGLFATSSYVPSAIFAP